MRQYKYAPHVLFIVLQFTMLFCALWGMDNNMPLFAMGATLTSWALAGLNIRALLIHHHDEVDVMDVIYLTGSLLAYMGALLALNVGIDSPTTLKLAVIVLTAWTTMNIAFYHEKAKGGVTC
jgi:hypothetical protein